MWRLVATLVLLFGGVGLGFALARSKWRLVAALVFVTLLALFGVALVSKTSVIQCRLFGGFWSEDTRPPELVGAWVGWDTSYPTPYCRLDLDADGTGRCAFWYEREETSVWRVTRWSVSGYQIELSVESENRHEQMRGEVSAGALSLRYFGSDGPDVIKNWFGPLHLVREATDAEAKQAVQRALERR